MRPIAQTAFLMAILTLVSKGFGFLREMVMANYFGTSYITDAYVMASTILTVLFGGIVSAISVAYIPVYSKIREQGGEEQGNQFTNSIINLLFLISVLISLIGILFSDQITAIFAGGFTGKTAELVSFYIKTIFSFVVFSSTSGIIVSFLQYKGIYLPQIISGYFISICSIAAIVISAHTSHYYLAYGILAGNILRFIGIFVIARKNGYRHKWMLKQTDQLKDIFLLTLPTFVSSYMTNISSFIEKTMASGLAEGSVSALNYAYLLNTMIMTVAISIMSTIVYPKLAKANSKKQYESFNHIVNTGLLVIFIIAAPCSLGAMAYSGEIIQAVYARGAFDTAATGKTGPVFFFYSIGMVFMSVNTFLPRVFYALHNMKTPMIYAAISVVINVGLNLILIRSMGLEGLALGASIAALCNSVMLLTGLRTKSPKIQVFQKKTVKKLAVILTAAAGAIALSYAFFLFFIPMLIGSALLQLILAVAVGAFAYLGLLILFRVEEVRLVKQLFKRGKN